jgi:hypothetical protein
MTDYIGTFGTSQHAQTMLSWGGLIMIYPTRGLYSGVLHSRLWTALYISTIYDCTILISSSVNPYNSYTRRSILPSVDSISRCRDSFSCGNRGLRLCSSSMRSTNETSLSCRAFSGIVVRAHSKNQVPFLLQRQPLQPMRHVQRH